jgi:alpha-amylase
MKYSLIVTLGLLILLSACSSTPPEPSAEWWEEAVFYEIFVRSFYDSNCDGIGDFNGITEKLEYLEELGVTALWLMPIFPSTSYHGYDVVNYFNVNPEFGTMADFQNLVEKAHEREIRIIIDLVINHTSYEHPWFRDAVSSVDSEYRDWYLWSDVYPGYNGPMGTAWHTSDTGYYYGAFFYTQPDLNYTNPEVTAKMEEISAFWLNEIGVNGFRVDGARHLIEEGQKQSDTDSTHNWFREYYLFYKGENPQAYTVGEISGASAFIAKTYTGDQFDQVFNFDLAYGFINSANNGTKQAAVTAINFTLKDMPEGNYATFLTNHDQNRSMNTLGEDVNKAKVAASLLLTAQGTPFIYYGEEIGMLGKKPDEDIRRPMWWSDEPNAGFSCPDAIPWRPPLEDHTVTNVVRQQEDPTSLLSHYQSLIELRKSHPALNTGLATIVETDDQALFSVLRTTSGEQILVVINLSGEPIDQYALSVEQSPLARGKYIFKALMGELGGPINAEDEGRFVLEVDSTILPFETLILNLN